MITINFSISDEQLKNLLSLYPNTGKNSDIGKLAVEVAKLYFLSINEMSTFRTNQKGVDLAVEVNGLINNFEIKGTAGKNLAWSKLKVSSLKCHDLLIQGTILIRITNIGSKEMTFYFLRYGEDFELKPEPRWAVLPIRERIE